jgi:hypothetical protein
MDKIGLIYLIIIILVGIGLGFLIGYLTGAASSIVG